MRQQGTRGKGRPDLTVATLKGCNGPEVMGGAQKRGATGRPTNECHLCVAGVSRAGTSDGMPRKGRLTNSDGEDDMFSEGGRKKAATVKRGGAK